MSSHPIHSLMETAMEKIKSMVDVSTIVGDPVQTPDGSVILPISKVGFGFVAGGSNFQMQTSKHGIDAENHAETCNPCAPFGGGSSGGVSIRPIAFLVVGKQGVNIVPLDNQTHIFEKLIDAAPQWIDKIQDTFGHRHATGSSHSELSVKMPGTST